MAADARTEAAQPVGGPLAGQVGGPVGGPLDPSAPRAKPASASGFLEVEETPVALPLALAAGGALIGALLWAGIAYATGMEIGYVAWILGGLVGGGCVLGGGRGPALAAVAAVLAFGGMVGGRVYGTSLLVDEQIESVGAMFNRQSFEQMKVMAAEVASDDFMASPAGEAALGEYGEDYDDEDMAEFRAAQQQMLAMFDDPNFTFERWRDEMVTGLREQVSLWDILGETIGLIDILFVLLGLSTAYGMVARASAKAVV